MNKLAKFSGFTPSRFPIGHPNHPNAVPRWEVADEGEIRNGVEWVRNFPRVCPFCNRCFYSWAPQPWPDPIPGKWEPNVPQTYLEADTGHRETCGQTGCIIAAQDEHSGVCKAEYLRRESAARERASLKRAMDELDEREAKERGL